MESVLRIAKTENMASIDFQSLWDEGYYRLLDDDVCHCHTYNPAHRTPTSQDKKVILLLGEP